MATAFFFPIVAGPAGHAHARATGHAQGRVHGRATYNQVFTMHGAMMLFLFAIPMLEGVAVYLMPKMLGARDFAFPRLTADSYWCYLFVVPQSARLRR